MATNGFSFLSLQLWMALEKISLPVPLSPSNKTWRCLWQLFGQSQLPPSYCHYFRLLNGSAFRRLRRKVLFPSLDVPAPVLCVIPFSSSAQVMLPDSLLD